MYVVSAHQNYIRPLLDIPMNQSLEQIVRRTKSAWHIAIQVDSGRGLSRSGLSRNRWEICLFGFVTLFHGIIPRTLSRNPSQSPNIGFVTFLRSSSLLTLCPGKERGCIYVLKLVPTVLEMAITVILNDSSVALGAFQARAID